MYGWRGRIGLLAPSRGDTLLYEFYLTAPPGVMAVPFSCELSRLSRRELLAVNEQYLAGVKKLSRERLDVISVGGTPPQILEGWSGAQELMRSLRAISDTPLVGCAESEVDAVRAVGAKRIALVTPHEDELNGRLRSMFEAAGIVVSSISGAGHSDTVDIAMESAGDVYRRVMKVAKDLTDGQIDGVHITCPRWPTIEILAPLEESLGIPVTSGAQAQLWAAYSAIGVSPKKAIWGSLFSSRRAFSVAGKGASLVADQIAK